MDTGISLRLTGYIADSGKINMILKLEVSDAGAPVNSAPTTTVRKASTAMSVASGDAIVLGGLTKETYTDMVSRIPILGNIPIIGDLLFKSKHRVKSKTEVVILIIPRLMSDRGDPILSPNIPLLQMSMPIDNMRILGLKDGSANPQGKKAPHA